MNKHERAGVIWNVFGGILNASTSVLLFFCVTRICGVEQAGIFAVVFATAQMLMEVGCHGIRGYQASDVEEKYSFKDYEVNRFISCTIMMIGVLLIIGIKGYTEKIASLMLWVGIFKMIDALADVYEGGLQQHHNLEECGKSLSLRTFFCILAFATCLIITDDVVFASFIMAIVSIVLFIGLAYLPAKRLLIKRKIEVKNIFEIFKESFPLFVSLVLLAYVANIPKYAIETWMPYENQTYYNIIFLPAQVIYLVVIYVFKPYITRVAQIYNENWDKYRRYVIGLILLTMVISGLAIGVSSFVGIPVLEKIYGLELKTYKMELLVIMVGGATNAIAGLMYYFLTIIRKQSVSMLAYIIGTVAALLCSDFLVRTYGILGATICYDVSTGIIMIIMLVAVVSNIQKRKNEFK